MENTLVQRPTLAEFKKPGLSPTLYEMQVRAFWAAFDHGFWDYYVPVGGKDNMVEVMLSKLALIHSEASEAVEEIRKGSQGTYYREADGKPEGIGAELADIVIRVGDLATALGIDLGAAVLEKMDFNDTRPRMHGKLA